METEKKKRKKRLIGEVVSDKMDKTITVKVERLVQHPRYKKFIKRATKFYAHDPHNQAREGDLVEIEFTRPLSKLKRWRLVKVVRRAHEAVLASQEQEQKAEEEKEQE